jgi:hypothetical protein
VTKPDWLALATQINAAAGPNAGLDAAIAEAFRAPAADYTESTEAGRRLVALALPGWHLHLGFGVSGVFPYAVITKGDERAEAEAPTVPLAHSRQPAIP